MTFTIEDKLVQMLDEMLHQYARWFVRACWCNISVTKKRACSTYSS
jgi:hypothetical protein